MNFFKIAKTAALYEKLAMLFTLAFLVPAVVIWGISKIGFFAEFFAHIATVLGYGALLFCFAYVGCNLVRGFADVKILKGNVRKQY